MPGTRERSRRAAKRNGMERFRVSEIKQGHLHESISTHKNRRPLGRLFLWVKMDSNHRSRETADLQSAPFGHSGIHPA